MKLLRSIDALPAFPRGSVAAIGNFDGVHLGHQALLGSLKKKAKQLKLPVVVILFEPQPGEFFLQEEAPARLTSLREKLLLLKEQDVDYVFCLKFNADLANTTAEDFSRNYLFEALQCKYLLVGQDFRYGANRQGDWALLQQTGKDYGCQVDVFSDLIVEGERVSSTKIRASLAKADLGLAKKLLGRSYSMCGRVLVGAGRGRQWGVPTANLKLNRHALPLKGVFCVKVKTPQQEYNGVANIGSRPTVDGSKNLLEIHLHDFDGSLYGELLQVFFLHKLRDEVKFESVDDLIRQIRQDVSSSKHYFLGNASRISNDFVE